MAKIFGIDLNKTKNDIWNAGKNLVKGTVKNPLTFISPTLGVASTAAKMAAKPTLNFAKNLFQPKIKSFEETARELGIDLNNMDNSPVPYSDPAYGGGGGGGSAYIDNIYGGGGGTGNSTVDELLARMEQYVQALAAQGKRINPNIEISPETAQQFLSQATREVEPYFQEQYKAIEEDVSRELTRMSRKFELAKTQSARDLKNKVRATENRHEESGTAFSGERIRETDDIEDQANENIQEAAEASAHAAGQVLRSAEQQVGSSALAGIQKPVFDVPTATIGTNPTLAPSTKTINFYNPLGLTGELARRKTTAIEERKAALESAERQRRGLNFYN